MDKKDSQHLIDNEITKSVAPLYLENNLEQGSQPEYFNGDNYRTNFNSNSHIFRNRWVALALVSGLLYGVGNYFYAIRVSKELFYAVGFLSPVAFCLLLIEKIFTAISFKLTKGTFFDKENSCYFKRDGNHNFYFSWINLLIILISMLPNVIGTIISAYGFSFASRGNLNQGIIPILYSLTGLYNAIVFYFLYNEKIKKYQVLGMTIMMILCISCILISCGRKLPYNNDPNTSYYAFVSILFGALSSLCFSLRSITIKKFQDRFSYQSFAVEIVFFDLFFCFIIFLVYIYHYELNWQLLYDGTLAGIMISIGKTLIPICIMEGLAGPTTTLAMTMVIYQTILCVIFQGQHLNSLEVVGLIMGIAAAVIVSGGDMILKGITNK